MPDTSKKTMKPANVLYPDSRHALLAAYGSSFKGQALKILTPKLEEEPDLSFAAADKLIRKSQDKIKESKEKKECYFKVGLIGSDLVLRVKTEREGLAKMLGYEQKDALLATGCKMAAAKGADKTKFKPGTYMVLTNPGGTFAQYFDIGKGYGINLSMTIEGSGDPAVLARVSKVHQAFCKRYQEEAEKIAAALGKKLDKLTVKSGQSLMEAAEEGQAQLEALLDKNKVQREFEEEVRASLAEDEQFRKHLKQWKFKCAFTAVMTTLKLATSIMTLVSTHGADVTSYFRILACGYAIYALVKDMRATEEEIQKELEKSIANYIRSAEKLVDEIKEIYEEHDIPSKTGLSKLSELGDVLGDSAQVVQGAVSRKIEKLTGKKVLQQPEDARLRYVVEVGKFITGADAKCRELDTEMEKFRRSSISTAVKVWPLIQKLKVACDAALEAAKEKKTYAENAKKKLEDLGIDTDDRTSMDKLEGLYKAIKGFKTEGLIDGGVQLAKTAKDVKGAYDAVKAFASAVEAFV